MPVILPLRPSIGNYEFRSVLAGVEYRFRCRWNRQTQAYYLDVFEINGDPIIYGAKIVLGVYLGRISTHLLFRRGAFACRIPAGDDRREPQFDDLGSRVQLCYFTSEELFVTVVNSLTRETPTS